MCITQVVFFLSVSSSCTAFGGFLIGDLESILGKVKTVKTTYIRKSRIPERDFFFFKLAIGYSQKLVVQLLEREKTADL